MANKLARRLVRNRKARLEKKLTRFTLGVIERQEQMKTQQEQLETGFWYKATGYGKDRRGLTSAFRAVGTTHEEAVNRINNEAEIAGAKLYSIEVDRIAPYTGLDGLKENRGKV